MGETLMGKETSGTPLETRGGTRDFAGFLQGLLRGQGGRQVTNMTAPFQGLTTDALMTLFADPNIGSILSSVLADPASTTEGLFASMKPFEDRAIAEGVAGTRNIFGSMGGRFSRNVGEAEARTRGEMGAEFARTRRQGLLDAGAQRAASLFQLINAAQNNAQMSLAPLQLMSQFFQPGAPQFQQGILPGLLSAGTTLGAMALMPPIRPAARATRAGAGRALNRAASNPSIFRLN